MEKMLMSVFLLLMVGSIFTSCTTKRYGRLQGVTNMEAGYLTCESVRIEIDKAQSFKNKISLTDSEFTKEDLLGFLGDLGIGNKLEYNDALESANLRLKDLNAISINKKCT